MGTETRSIVNWQELEVLQNEIRKISEKIGDLREVVSQAITVVGEEWQDSKYEEFVDSYEHYKQMMEDISNEYLHYANDALPPFIEQAKLYESIQSSR